MESLVRELYSDHLSKGIFHTHIDEVIKFYMDYDQAIEMETTYELEDGIYSLFASMNDDEYLKYIDLVKVYYWYR